MASSSSTPALAPAPVLSHSERAEKFAASKASLVQAHAEECAVLAAKRAALDDGRLADLARIEREHEVQLEAAAIAFSRRCASEFAPLVETFVHTPDRPAAVALTVRYRALDEEAKIAVGRELTGVELAQAFAARRIERDQDLLANYANPEAFTGDILGCGNTASNVHRVLVGPAGGDVSLALPALLALEQSVVRAASCGKVQNAERRFAAQRFGGTRPAIARQLKAILDVENAARTAESFAQMRRKERGLKLLDTLSRGLRSSDSDSDLDVPPVEPLEV